MSKIYISYFYQIRFFKPYMIPLSTAVWDPKWFHDFKDTKYIFRDKNGVYNGVRVGKLAPKEHDDGRCRGRENCNPPDPDNCNFLKYYREQLDAIDFQWFLGRLDALGQHLKSKAGFSEEPVLVLIVYEAPSNPCSERGVLQQWFHDNGYELEELNPKEFV